MSRVRNEDILQPTTASLSYFKLVLAIYPNTGPRQPKQRAGNSAHSPSLTPEALPLFLSPSLSPFLVMEKCPDQSMGGWKTGEKREVDERK